MAVSWIPWRPCDVTLGLSLLISLLVRPVPAGKDDLIVNTEKGRVRGMRYYLPDFDKSVDTYLGIPFAKPPTGLLRFLHPQPVDKWNGIYNATRMPNSCYQLPDTTFGPDFYGSNMWNPDTKVSEDCLYLNVWVPKTRPRLKRSAVMVWIFGGGFFSGSPTLNLYDGKILAALNDLIVVSIGYRVGSMGFLYLGHPSAPGNAGLFDQLMALEWVQQNIKSFGGDPNNVTLFGESAGAVSVSLHLLSPLSRDKFQRAILQSGSANMPWASVTPDEGLRRSEHFAKEWIGCAADGTMQELSDCLRMASPATIVENEWVTDGIIQFPWVPVVDGAFLVEHPVESLRRRNFKKCPILLGSNHNEGSFWIIYELAEILGLDYHSMTEEQYEASMDELFYFYPQHPHINTEFGLSAIKFHYANHLESKNDLKNIHSVDHAIGDSHFLCHVNKFAEIYASAGENVYYYYFTQRYSSNPWPSWMGVLHGDEIIFTFGDALKKGYLNYTKGEKALSIKIMQYWTNFAKTG